LFHERRFDGADVLLATIAAHSSLTPFVLHMRGIIAMHLGQNERARQFLSKAIRANPADAEAHANLGILLLDAHQHPAAVAAYAAALSLDPRNASSHFRLAKGLAALGLADLAADSYRDACALAPDYAEAELNLGALLNDRGGDAEAPPSGGMNGGSQSCRSKADPVLCDALFVEGVRHYRADELGRSKKLFERVLSFDPEHVNTLCNLGTLEGRLGHHRRALELLEHAVAIAPKLVQARLALADILLACSKTGEMMAQYQEALELAPKSDAVHAALAMALEALGDHAGAMNHFERAVKINQRQSPEFYAALGRTSLARGNLQGAEISFQHALALQPKLAAAHAGLGHVWLAFGRQAEAVPSFRHALEMDSHCRSAQLGLEQALADSKISSVSMSVEDAAR
jgi:tetratricopeptide (TPR) repeat protein